MAEGAALGVNGIGFPCKSVSISAKSPYMGLFG